MRTLLLAASTLAITTAVPALSADIYVPVQEQFPEAYFEGNKAAGYIDLHYGFAWYDGDNPAYDETYRLAGIAGRGNLPFSKTSMFNLQLDGTAETIFASGKNSSATPVEATAHLYYRDPARYALGAFGSYGIVEGSNVWGGGAEGQLFLNRFTLYGQAGYRGIDFDSGNRTQWYVRGVGRYFPTDNIRLEGEIGFAQDGFDGSGTTIDTLFWSATAEYRFDHMPLGIYAQYRGANFQVESNLLNNVNMAVLGVRAHLGSDSLFDNDRRGASFDTHVPDLWIAPSPEGK